MTAASCPQPWIANALELLDLRREDRVLVLGATPRPGIAAIQRAVGTAGTVLAVDARRGGARRLVEHAGVDVVLAATTGRERFGVFDALFAAPLADSTRPLAAFGSLAVGNLRPGGRFVLDLPGEVLCEDLAQAWSEIGGEESALRPLFGPSGDEATRALREAGLRRVEVVLATHLLSFESPLALAWLGHDLLGAAGDSQRESYGLALVRRLRTNGAVEVAFKRTRVFGMR